MKSEQESRQDIANRIRSLREDNDLTIEDMAKAIIENDYKMRDVEGVKPVFRLHPPVKGYEGNKEETFFL